MRKYFVLILTVLISSSAIGQGLIKDSKASDLIKKNPRVQKSRSINLPPSYSLEQYTPHVFDQGNSDMCAAYSLALARTMIYARNNKLSDKNKISAEAYSPYYIYTKYKSVSNESFDGGLRMYFNKLNEYGYAKIKEIEYPHYFPFTEKQLWDFSTPSYTNLQNKYIKSEKFDQINTIYVDDIESKEGRKELINLIKQEIVKERPILFGMNIYDTFSQSKDVWSDDDETWCNELINTNDGEDYCYAKNSNPSGMCDRHKPEDYYSGHAMTLIAYDDNKYFGSFLIQNSWGIDSHNNGKVWIPYDVFARLAEEIQSVDKKAKTMFDEEIKYTFNYPDIEIIDKTKDFGSDLDSNWFLFTAMAIEKLDEKDVKKGRVILPNNLIIEGTLSNNLLNGFGKINLNNKYVYEGNFKNGFFDGNGKLLMYDLWGDISSYREGEFKDGKFLKGNVEEIVNLGNHYAILWGDRRNGYSYSGNFSDGNYNGYGVMKHNQYEWEVKGDFKDGWPIKGKQTTDWFEYEGELKYMLWHGRGKLTWWDNSVYEGNFERGEFIE